MDDKNYVYTECPACDTEHRVHKIRADRDMIRYTNCKAYFVVSKIPKRLTKTEAFMKVFAPWRKRC